MQPLPAPYAIPVAAIPVGIDSSADGRPAAHADGCRRSRTGHARPLTTSKKYWSCAEVINCGTDAVEAVLKESEPWDCPAANAGLPHVLPAGFDEVAVSPPRHARPLTTAAGLGYWLGWFTCTCTSGIGWADSLTALWASYQLNTLEKVPRGPQGRFKQHVHFHKSGFGAGHCLGRACARSGCELYHHSKK